MSDLRAQLADRFESRAHPLREVSRHWTDQGVIDMAEITFATAAGAPVRGVLCRPKGAQGPLPTVLVIHAHGNRYHIGADELMQGRPALARPLGPDLAALGVQSLCVDMPCFGARADMGESAVAKAALWRGGSLAGQMLGENASALDWLIGSGLADTGLIAVFGISMGATLGLWLAAVDLRVRALVQMCCFADYAALIAAGAHDLHGIYLTVPGLLNIASNGEIAALIAPRAQFIGWGTDDPLTPPAALAPALGEAQAGYGAQGGQLVLYPQAGVGHSETQPMREAALGFVRAALLG
jgi:dienelactone hydrolase